MIHHGDCVEVMAGMEPESVDAVVADLRATLLRIYDLSMREGVPPRLDIRDTARAALANTDKDDAL